MCIHIKNLTINNISNLDYELEMNKSTVISGWSGSGKSSFVNAIFKESLRRFALLLPKSEYRFLFHNDIIKSDRTSDAFYNIPLMVFIENRVTSHNQRATIGTKSGILKSIRDTFAKTHNTSRELFSYNLPLSWCNKCSGKGTFNGNICPNCNGDRWSDSIKDFRIHTKLGNLNIVEISLLPLDKIATIADDLHLSGRDMQKIHNMESLNIAYLHLLRSVNTLSGGEYARLTLSNYLGLTKDIAYIIDEPSLGLDEENINNLLNVLNELGKHNQIFIIDHNKNIRQAAQKNIYFGEKSAALGGKIVPDLKDEPEAKLTKNASTHFLELHNIYARNIKLKTLNIPLHTLSVVTGESGVGKSTLVNAILDKVSNCKTFYIKQDMIRGITSKSTIATYIGFMDVLRKKVNCNICPNCNGSGLCEEKLLCVYCDGIALSRETLETTLCGMSIKDILTAPISLLCDILKDDLYLKEMEILNAISSGYLSLNRKINTLSGGEFQRVCLAKVLGEILRDRNNEEQIVFLDEPTKGLSKNYVNDLLYFLKNALHKKKNLTFVLIEHNKTVIDNADYVCDLGKRRILIDSLYFCNQYEKKDSYYPHETICK